MARPRKEIDQEQLIKLMQIQCTEQEIAGLFEMTIDTLNARCKEMFGLSFSDTYKIHSQEGKKSLRRKQFEIALSGNPGMLIWLGKQYLGQTDKSEVESTLKGSGLKITFDEE